MLVLLKHFVFRNAAYKLAASKLQRKLCTTLWSTLFTVLLPLSVHGDDQFLSGEHLDLEAGRV
jgi:hypothetical protein